MAMTRESPALEDLVRHSGWMRRLAGGLLRDPDAAEDAVQEALIAGWRHAPERDRTVRPWLGQVVRNAARSQHRAERRRQVREAGARAFADGDVTPPDRLLADAQLHRLVAEAVTQLDEPFRQTLVLRYYEGLSAAEIARQLGVPEGTVRWRTKQGLDRVRATLDAHHGGDRRRWQRALLPLLPARTSSWPAAPALAVGAVTVAVLLTSAWVLVAPPRRPAEATTAPVAATPVGEPDAPVPDVPSSGPPALPSGMSCAERIERQHAEVVRLEADLFRWDSEFAWAMGEPNPAAERELRPFADAIVGTGDDGIQEYRFECRTWMCRIVARQGPDTSGLTAGDPRLFARVRSATSTSSDAVEGMPARDGTYLSLLYLRLRQPSALPTEQELSPPARAMPTISSDDSDCDSLAAAYDKELTTLRDRWATVEPRDHEFERSDVNEAMRAEMDSHLPWWKRLLGTTECRGDVCRREGRLSFLPAFLWSPDDAEVLESLQGHYLLGRTVGGGPTYLELEPRTQRRTTP